MAADLFEQSLAVDPTASDLKEQLARQPSRQGQEDLFIELPAHPAHPLARQPDHVGGQFRLFADLR